MCLFLYLATYTDRGLYVYTYMCTNPKDRLATDMHILFSMVIIFL